MVSTKSTWASKTVAKLISQYRSISMSCFRLCFGGGETDRISYDGDELSPEQRKQLDQLADRMEMDLDQMRQNMEKEFADIEQKIKDAEEDSSAEDNQKAPK